MPPEKRPRRWPDVDADAGSIPSGNPTAISAASLRLAAKWRLPSRRAGSGAWAGLCNTHFWVDRTAGVCASIYSNFLPFVPPDALALYADFEQALS